MMFKLGFLLSFLALFNIVIANNPPGCLLSIVGDTKNPDDLKTICGHAGKYESKISDKCGDHTQAAMKAFANSCKEAGHKVEIKTATGTATKGSSTKTGFVTATKTGSGSRSSSTSTSVTTSGSDSDGGSSSGSHATSTSTSGSGSGSGSGSSTGTSGNSGSSSTSTSASSSTTTASSGGQSDRQVSAAAFAAVVFVGFAAAM